LKYLYNPATDSFEALEPTMRDRFALGGRVNFDKGSPFPITDDVLKQIKDLVEDTNLNLKQIGDAIGYGTEKRSLTIDTPVMEAYIEKYGKPKIGRFKPSNLAKAPEYVQYVIDSVKEKGVSATARDLNTQNKTIRNVLKQFAPELIKPANEPGEVTSAKKAKAKALENIKIAEKKAGVNTTSQAKQVMSQISDFNETYKNMSPKDLAKDKSFLNRLRMHIDINSGAVTYDGYTKDRPVKGKVFTDLELAQHAIKKATAGELFTSDHIIPKSLKKQNVGYPINFQPATYIENSNFDNARNYVVKNPDANALEIDNYLKKNNQTLRFPEQKIKLGYQGNIVFNSETGNQTLVELAKKPKPTPRGGSNVKAKITEFRNTAQNVVNKIPFRMVPAAGAAAIDFGVFAGLLGTPIDEAIVGASGWLTKRPELGKALGTIATQYSEGKINLSELRQKSLPILKEIAKEQLPESKLPPVAEEINEKMGEGTIKIADDVPEPESAERKRMFDEANERFNEMEISDIDNPFMAAMGGRVGFKDGTPNPVIEELLSGLNNTEVMDNILKNNTPSLEESMFGTKEESNLLQRLNQTLDPRAFPYYAAQITKGVALAPEFAARLTLAAPKALADLAQGKSGVGAEFAENIDPKVTQRQVIERFGLQKILDDMDQDITGSQRTVGDLLKLAGESVGPATGVGYFASAGKAANKIRKEIQKYAGSAEAAKELEKSVEEKAASLQMTRREFNSLLAGGGIIGLVKALGLDSIFPAAKTVAQKAAPEIITKGGTPKYFFDFVNLIKTKGDDITETAATVERQKVYDYNGYTMYEDMTTGKISIRKDTEGGATYSIGDGEYETVDGIIRKEEINYEPSETILNEKGKPVKVPDQYDEATVRPDEDGGEGDFEAGLDSIDDILDLLSKDGKTYSKDELIEMGIRPDVLTESSLKTKKAGGGIIKLAGDDSGPPPKSGPTPHGLPYVAKNVRPIKERK
jgi:hypothetical protein